jgi:hypothetical protein
MIGRGAAGERFRELGMKRILAVLVAAALSGVAVVGTSSSAEARWWGYGGWGYRAGCCGGGWGYRGLGWGPGGFAAGAVVGATLATPYYYYPLPAYPAYYYYSYPAPAYYYYGAGGGCCY